ncbi:MAG: class I SAM-dependent methyltransferase [Candidatus Babeliales bacterium]|jgi:SAM-dependent methyltransferase
MENFWKSLWDAKAQTENYFTQTGRGNSFTMYQFLLYIQDVQNALQLCKNDVLLDCGGGPGWITFHLAPFVWNATMFDYSPELVKKAQAQAQAFNNVFIFQDDILTMQQFKLVDPIHPIFTKVLVGSVLQYLSNMDEVQTALQNIYNVMRPGGKCLLTHNPDLSKKESHIASMPQTEESLQQENARLWINPQEMMYLSLKAGFSECLIKQINPQIWQSSHMVDYLVIK